MEEGEVSVEDVVEVDPGVVPGVVKVVHRLTLVAPWHDAVVDRDTFAVDAVLEAATEQVDAHDTEDEPEDKTDQKYIEDSWDCLDQRVNDHLHRHAGRTTVTQSINVIYARLIDNYLLWQCCFFSHDALWSNEMTYTTD